MPPLHPQAVHLWTQPLALPAGVLAAYWRLLSGPEKARAERFHFDLHRNRYIAARGRLRQILACYLEAPDPAQIVFTYNAQGKPALPDSALRFNLSHSEDLAVYAVVEGREVGIDIERVRSLGTDRIPESFFSPTEVGQLRELPTDVQNEAFFQCWTRKEAYIKAQGGGLSIPLDSFDVSLRPGEPACFLRNGDGWSMQAFRIHPDYIGAVVLAGHADWEVVYAAGALDSATSLR